METNLDDLNENSKSLVVPQITTQFQELMEKIRLQKDNNTKLQKQLTLLKKDKSSMSQHLDQYKGRLAVLEAQIGL